MHESFQRVGCGRVVKAMGHCDGSAGFESRRWPKLCIFVLHFFVLTQSSEKGLNTLVMLGSAIEMEKTTLNDKRLIHFQYNVQ